MARGNGGYDRFWFEKVLARWGGVTGMDKMVDA